MKRMLTLLAVLAMAAAVPAVRNAGPGGPTDCGTLPLDSNGHFTGRLRRA
jgi:hypothetical protein